MRKQIKLAREGKQHWIALLTAPQRRRKVIMELNCYIVTIATYSLQRGYGGLCSWVPNTCSRKGINHILTLYGFCHHLHFAIPFQSTTACLLLILFISLWNNPYSNRSSHSNSAWRRKKDTFNATKISNVKKRSNERAVGWEKWPSRHTKYLSVFQGG